MIEILSLPRRFTLGMGHVSGSTSKTGLPINSLPGWEQIPLNSKLPMLKCPGNQVVFSKNKIGQTFKNLKQDFDPSGRDPFPEYNPLHDCNLKRFYANERNLKRLRENGEITQENDVICTLKDFNEYRQQLHKSQLYYVLQDIHRLEAEQRDRMLISNAEVITGRDHRNLNARHHTYNTILMRKQELDEAKMQYFQNMMHLIEDRFRRIGVKREMERIVLEHKIKLNAIRMSQHKEACLDLQRKHLIKLKKLFQFKTERLKRNMKLNMELRSKVTTAANILSWEKRLQERIKNQVKIHGLLDQVNEQQKISIENHRQRYTQKWQSIQEDIRKRAKRIYRKKHPLQHRRKKKKPIKEKPAQTMRTSFCSEFQESFEKLLDTELCEALKTAIDIESNVKVTFDNDDPIYKAAKFIIQHIITKFDKDLSTDKQACRKVSKRMKAILEESCRFVLFRATQIITSTRESMLMRHEQKLSNVDSSKRSSSKFVAFSRISSTIGISSYEIHPEVDVRDVYNRTPTPPGSLASIVVKSNENLSEAKAAETQLCRNELVYIEHYVNKFRRELIVGMGRRVFAAIQCHFDNKIMDVRKDMLGVDRNFMVQQVTHAILSFAINSLNYESALKLCISSLSSEIIWSLQKNLLKPDRDPRVLRRPRCDCVCGDGMKVCHYCHN